MKTFKVGDWVWTSADGKGGTVTDFDKVDGFFVVFSDGTDGWFTAVKFTK